MQPGAVLELVRARWSATTDDPTRGFGNLDDIATPVIAFDHQRVIVAANLAAEHYTRQPRAELIGRSVDLLVPARFRQPDAPPPVATTEVTTVELSALRGDGTEVMTVWTFAALDEATPVFVMTLRERTHVLADLEASVYATVFDKAPIPMALTRLTDNTLVMMNEAFAELFEVQREELIGRTSADLGIATIDQRNEIARLLAETGGVRDFECERRTATGKTVHISLSVTALRIGDVDHLMSTVQDISARKAQQIAVAQARAAADLERQKLRSILMQAPIAICMLEGPDHRFTFANPRYLALVGNRNVIGKPLLEALPDVRENEFDKLLDRVRATGEPFVGRDAAVKLTHHGPDEKLVVDFVYAPIRNENGEIDAIVAVVADVTERATTNAALIENRARADYAVRLSGIGFWYCDLPFDELAWDARVKEHFFLPPDARVTIETFYDRIVPEDRERTRAAIDASIQEHRLYDVNYRTHHPEHGGVKWIRAMGGASYASDGTPIRFDGVTVDITKQKHDEERMANAAAELEDANRVKDDFLAMLGHELRNPLAPITTAVQLLKLRQHKGRELDVIERQAAHLTHLVDDLLDISRITRGKVELQTQPCEIGEIVRAALEMVAPLIASAEHVLIQDVPSGLLVDVDRRRMVQVISNLLSNAARYTPPRGQLTVTAFRDGAEVGVSVADTGEGIEPDLLPRVFDMFVQARQGLARSQGGLGLGLAIVKGLVAAHGGRVSAHSAGPGRGSVFEVRLPAAEATVAAPVRSSSWVSAVAPMRVLIVDDNVDSSILLSEALTALGCQTAVAHDGLRALEVADEFDPDVILLDIGLPLLDGYEVARQLHARRPDLDVIAVSGYGQAADVERSRDAGFRAHLTKPVDLTKLSALLRERTPRA